MITFTRAEDGFVQTGEVATSHGRFQWLRDDGKWDAGWAIEPVVDLIERMHLDGPYRYSAYRILGATKPELLIKPTCYGCGVIAGIGCGFNPLGVGRDFGKCNGDPLVDFNEDHQFSISLPVMTSGKNFAKHKLKAVYFNSIRCANLALLELTQRVTGTRGHEVVHYDYDCQTLAEYRAAQGFKRCPTCRKIHKLAVPFCDEVCQEKYAGDVTTILEVSSVLTPQQAIVELRGRCANKACGQGRDERGSRVRARVPDRGNFCSKECRVKVREALRQAKKRPEAEAEAVAADGNTSSGT